jgi:hypothetical protein
MLNDDNLPNNLLTLTLENTYTHSINSNIIIFKIIDDFYTEYHCKNTNLIYQYQTDIIKKIIDYIEEYFIKNKLIGQIIFKELTEKIFHPTRLLNICDMYNIEFDQLMEIY